ncbi:MAG: EF-Tu/IF-2/RF-3 family GTPase [Eubacteriales bacterium]|nr:EF-Tu/IF-2/RF-3 family GTPase [Eubacteriales bacterium]
MGLFDFFKKPKTDLEQYYEERGRREREQADSRYGEQLNSSYEGEFGSAGFRIVVGDIFTITGRGTVITGKIERGTVSVGDEVTLQRTDGSSRKTTVTGIEMFRKIKNTATAGENVGLLLRNVQRNEISRGDVLLK